MDLTGKHSVEAFAIIVDINGFTAMTNADTSGLIADFTRDVLYGSVRAIESHNGVVTNVFADAVNGLIEDPDDVWGTIVEIATDLDKQCEYISEAQQDSENCWEYAPGGASLKIAIEYGWCGITTSHTKLRGVQPFFVGPALIYASRISAAGTGNRCVCGPYAYERGLKTYANNEVKFVAGKAGEPTYKYHEISLEERWVEGPRTPDDESYLG